MSDVLERICADKHAHVDRRKAIWPLADVLQAARMAGPARGFVDRIVKASDAGEVALIAEIKKASPSKGLIREEFDPAHLAHAYLTGGASCLSVLTDVPYFQGHDTYLALARDAVGLPVLRKDFILDPYQVAESRALGADCILLIMAALTDAVALDLSKKARELGMDVLVEVHDAEEMRRALDLPVTLIGINNRDLKTLSVDLGTTETLATMVPSDRVLVAESGIHGHDDVVRMRLAGAKAILVGESLMREQDVAMATLRLLGREGDLRRHDMHARPNKPPADDIETMMPGVGPVKIDT